jgi:hypothetical protein
MARRVVIPRRLEQAGPFHDVRGSAHPRRTTELRVNEINTQRYAAGNRGPSAGGSSGQGPALDAK